MASIIDAFNDAVNDKNVYLKIFVYAIPVYFCADFFIKGQMNAFYRLGTFTLFLSLGLLALGIYNVRKNNKEILTINPLKILLPLLKMIIVIAPQMLIYYLIGSYLTQKITIPVDIPHFDLIFDIVIWSILCAILITSFISFARSLSIKDGFDLRIMFLSSIDLLLVLLFAIPQWLILNAILVAPVAYLFWFFKLPFTHWGFVVYCSLVFVLNISIIADYMAQMAYENIRSFAKDEGEDTILGSVIDRIDTEKHI